MVRIDANRSEDRGRLDGLGRARGARVCRDARPVEAEQHCLGQDTADRHVHDVRRALDAVPEHHDIIKGRGRLDERIGQVPGGGLPPVPASPAR